MTTETEPEIIYSRLIDETIAAIPPLDAAAMAAARERQAILTKPPGSLGRLETLSVQLAGITGQPVPQIAGKKIIVFAGDHLVTAEGVSPYPAEVTPQMVQNFLNGGAAINALAAQAGAELTVVDAGVNANLPLHPNLTTLKPGFGSANIAQGPAMHNWQAVRCLETGIRPGRPVDGRQGLQPHRRRRNGYRQHYPLRRHHRRHHRRRCGRRHRARRRP